MGFREEALGHNAIAGGFQGQRQWTDWKPNGDYTEALMNTSFDWNGIRGHSYWPQRTMPATVLPCCSGTCSQVAARCSPMCVHTGAPKRLNV